MKFIFTIFSFTFGLMLCSQSLTPIKIDAYNNITVIKNNEVVNN